MIYLTIFPFVIILLGGLAIFRVERVSNFRLKLMDDFFARPDWKDQLELFHEVSFNTMTYKFWKPLTIESFWGKDTKFLK